MCFIKSKKNALQSFVVLYPDIEAVLKERIEHNNWLPSILTSDLSKPALNASMKSTNEPFVLINEIKDENGGFYYKCLYPDTYGWIIGSKKHFDIIENKGKKCQIQEY